MSPEAYQIGITLKWLLTAAWLLPLIGFVVGIFSGYWCKRTSKLPAYVAVGCIATSCVLSVVALGIWSGATREVTVADHANELHAIPASGDQETSDHPDEIAPNNPLKAAFTGTFYRIARFGSSEVSLDYYIDGLTIVMFVMITLIAGCIHVYSLAYMNDELTDRYEDHEVHLDDHRHLVRQGRFARFFAFLSLFSFSMLGLILAGNIFQVFIFWELVGICSYFLIGFYVERKSASTAANKAFIMNRIGDFGFLIGLMILWTSFGVFHFAETNPESTRPPGLFQKVRSETGELTTIGESHEKVIQIQSHGGAPVSTLPYWLLTAAGLGIFAGCVGKSAQFPLQTWLPDAMEGPTPVSALVHSATMVAAGVYLVGRFYPLFTPEALLVIAYVGCVTLFIGATIAVVATDIKRVLAYSTMSQLGYMMLALGIGGWMAGLFHLVTHAFFKSLLFLCSGSVIRACHHEQDMTRMGGLARKMPITCWTMFIGVVAICGLAVPLLPELPLIGKLAFSGYHSKDSILASSLAFTSINPRHSLLFLVPLATAGITAFYMFRMWFMTFFGTPKVATIAEHASESPRLMTVPLIVLAFFAVTIGFRGENGPLVQLLNTSEPAHVAPGFTAELGLVQFPDHAQIHEHHLQAGASALSAAFGGTILAYLFYCVGWIDPQLIRRQFATAHRFLVNAWNFDELYAVVFVKPVEVISNWCATFDRVVIDSIGGILTTVVLFASRWDRVFDEVVVDRFVNWIGSTTVQIGSSFRMLQTGNIRQYLMFIAVSVVSLFILLFIFIPGR
ncbi:NADH-quinone oxidoreductase subunit L [Planctomicrobium sp. SH668]|uniref:NADH-quinone oxidoreductase subunit L n=1 Tax=Planctomicrobium sp. SH668 TaxID=3448126 RepID=UPI003F5ADFF4